jgi:Uma2 family endonuclease
MVDVVYLETAAMAVEIVSPDDETYEKFGFYAEHHVDELLVVEPDDHRVRIFVLAADGYDETGRSTLLGVDATILEQALTWPWAICG